MEKDDGLVREESPIYFDPRGRGFGMSIAEHFGQEEDSSTVEFKIARAAWRHTRPKDEPELQRYVESIKSTLGQPTTTVDSLYLPLKNAHYMRVLEVEPGDLQDDIVCTLHTCSIDFTYSPRVSREKPRTDQETQKTYTTTPTLVSPTDHAIKISDGSPLYYTALSYVWGPASFTSRISCNGRSKYITPSLETTIRHLRDRDEAVNLWADQLCINQHDLTERSQQVQIMGTIYRRAFNTVLWLGDKPAELAFQILRVIHLRCQFTQGQLGEEVYQDLEFMPCSLSEAWIHLEGLFSSPWFRRMWIIQEAVITGKSSFITSGSTHVAWDWLGAWCISLSESGFIDYLERKKGVEVGSSVTATGCRIAKGLYISGSYFLGHQTMGSLLSCLEDTRYAEATDPRDKVFALLGVCPSDIRVDYTATASEVFQNATLLCLKESQDHLDSLKTTGYKGITSIHSGLKFLSCIDHSPEPKCCPSWVPKWKDPRSSQSLAFSTSAESIYNAGHVVPDVAQSLSIKVLNDGKTLQLTGLLFDHIVAVNTPSSISPDLSCDDTNGLNEDLALLAKFASSCHACLSGDSIFSNFCYTLVAGKSGNGREKCPPEFADIISLLLDEATGQQPSLQGQTYSKRRLAGRFTRQNLRVRTFGKVFQDLRKAYKNAMRHRILYRTSKSYLGLGPEYMHDSDVVCIFAGYPVPFVLRPHENGTYLVIGETYLPGVMSGEAMDMSMTQDILLA